MNILDASSATDKEIVRLRNGCVRIDGATLIDGVDISLTPRAVTGLIGPNGAGKSTLLKVLARQQPLTEGELSIGDESYSSFRDREFARRIAYLPQIIPVTPGITVDELVCLGRFPWHGALGKFTSMDRAAVDEALEITGTVAFGDRFTDSLSGGERQRCWIAMLIAQEARVLLLDEPVSALDVRFQIEIMNLIRRIAQDREVAILVVLHDMNLAARYCGHITALKSGRIAWQGRAASLMDASVLEGIYETPMTLLAEPETGVSFAFASAGEQATTR